MKVAWLIQNLVPYHHARFEAFAAQGGVDAHIVQAISKDAFKVLEYSPESAAYSLHTLLDGVGHGEVDAAELRHATMDLLQRLRPDCLCVSGWGLAVGQAALLAGFRLNIPVVLCSDSNEFDESRVWHKEWIKKTVLSGCSAFFVAGSTASDYIERLGGRECIAGYDVVDNSYFARTIRRPVELPVELEDAAWFLACSRFGRKKNLIRLIEAYAGYLGRCTREGQLPHRLVIAGDGELREEIEAAVRLHELEAMVLLLGAVAYASLPWLYQNCRAFVHASTTEQWGLVVNEAMAAGAPVLLSNRCGCAPDLVREGANGFLFDPFNTDDMMEVLWKFQQLSSSERQAFGSTSVAIIDQWGPDRFAAGLKDATRKAVKTGSKKNTWLPRVLLKLLLAKGAGDYV